MKFGHVNARQMDFMRMLRDAGAISADTALTIDKNPTIPPTELEELVEVEAISRVAPYRYYLKTASRHARLLATLDSRGDQGEGQLELHAGMPRTRPRIVKAIVFWIIIILIPLLMLQFLGRKS